MNYQFLNYDNETYDLVALTDSLWDVFSAGRWMVNPENDVPLETIQQVRTIATAIVEAQPFQLENSWYVCDVTFDGNTTDMSSDSQIRLSRGFQTFQLESVLNGDPDVCWQLLGMLSTMEKGIELTTSTGVTISTNKTRKPRQYGRRAQHAQAVPNSENAPHSVSVA